MHPYSDCSILSIASGKAIYIDMAINLARSYLYWHREGVPLFYLATDHPESIPDDLIKNPGFKILPFDPGQYGESFSTKLHLDTLAQSNKCLFIDADCLITASLLPLFDTLKGHAVGVVGRIMSEGEWFGDVAHFCKIFGVPSIPGFNGCLYYIEKGELSSAVYERARTLEPQYEALGMKLLRGKPNDELLMSVSMAEKGLTGIPDTGNIYGDPQASQGPMQVDILKGISRMVNPPKGNSLHRDWHPFHITHPIIVHFLGNSTEYPPYTTQAFILRRTLSEKKSELVARTEAFIRFTLPWKLSTFFKKIFRPVYHSLFGYRKIKHRKRV